jgi:hypothetical protein
MPSTCVLSRVLSAAALGYVGASPFNDPLLSGAGAVVAVAGALAWYRWVQGARACAVPSPHSLDEDPTPTASVRRERRP